MDLVTPPDVSPEAISTSSFWWGGIAKPIEVIDIGAPTRIDVSKPVGAALPERLQWLSVVALDESIGSMVIRPRPGPVSEVRSVTPFLRGQPSCVNRLKEYVILGVSGCRGPLGLLATGVMHSC